MTLTIRITEEYRQQFGKARDSEDLRKCRLWTDVLGASEQAEVEIKDDCIVLRCNTSKGVVQDSCTYDGVLAVTEMREGILLRISHKRLLWLPVSGDGQENRLLVDAVMQLSTHCKYLFRTGHLRLKGIGFAKRIAFRFRPRKGYYTGEKGVAIAKIVFICLVLFAGAEFVTQPFEHRKIERQEAIALIAEFDSAHSVYIKHSTQYMNLQFRDAEEQTVEGCCLGYNLEEELKQLPSGTQMQLLIHPDSGSVLQIVAEEELLLEFDYAQKQLWNEAVAFLLLGLFMLAGGVGLAVAMILKKF